MKEASGELSMTAVAVVAIGAIGVLFVSFIFPNIKASLQRSQMCSAAFGCSCGTDALCNCSAYSGSGTSQTVVSVACDNPDVN